MKTAKTRTPSAAKARRAALSVRSILVPLDFSPASEKALAYASALAEQFGAKITLLFVAEPPGLPDFTHSFPLAMENEEFIAACKLRLAKIASRKIGNSKRIVKTLVREGRAYVEITAAARTLKVDLIVIATHGYSGVTHALLGSVTERVLRHAPCPVLVVRECEHEFVK